MAIYYSNECGDATQVDQVRFKTTSRIIITNILTAYTKLYIQGKCQYALPVNFHTSMQNVHIICDGVIYTYLQGVRYQPEIVPTPLSLLSNEDDDPNMPFEVRPCAKLLTALQWKHTNIQEYAHPLVTMRMRIMKSNVHANKAISVHCTWSTKTTSYTNYVKQMYLQRT